MLPGQEPQLNLGMHGQTEKKLVPDRFHLKKKLGQGTFSKCSPSFARGLIIKSEW